MQNKTISCSPLESQIVVRDVAICKLSTSKFVAKRVFLLRQPTHINKRCTAVLEPARTKFAWFCILSVFRKYKVSPALSSPAILVPHFPHLYFPPLHFWWSRIFHYRTFSQPVVKYGALISGVILKKSKMFRGASLKLFYYISLIVLDYPNSNYNRWRCEELRRI